MTEKKQYQLVDNKASAERLGATLDTPWEYIPNDMAMKHCEVKEGTFYFLHRNVASSVYTEKLKNG